MTAYIPAPIFRFTRAVRICGCAWLRNETYRANRIVGEIKIK